MVEPRYIDQRYVMAEPAAGLGYVVEQPGASQHYVQPTYIQVPAEEYHPLTQPTEVRYVEVPMAPHP